jgi:hypothetical protein
VGVCVIAEIFAESNGERPSSVSDVRCVTVGAGQFVYYGHFVFVLGVVTACVQEFINGVVRGVGYSDCGVLE